MNLYKAFRDCLLLDGKYISVENSGDYFIEKENGTLRIFLEWSDGREDWKNNFDFPVKPYKRMEHTWHCHRGFLRVWKSIEPYVSADILDPATKAIEIIGYSHGAAIALLCYEYCVFNRPDIDVQGVGFGAPRVFWGHIPKSVKERFKNFVVVRNGNDIVTHVPPALFGFQHVSDVLKIGQTNPIKDHQWIYYLAHLDDPTSSNV